MVFGASQVIQRDQFTINDGAIGKPPQGFHDVREFSAERFSVARIKRDAPIGLHCNRAISVELDFFCGDERYVVLTLIGDLAKRNFAEKHHII